MSNGEMVLFSLSGDFLTAAAEIVEMPLWMAGMGLFGVHVFLDGRVQVNL